MRPSTFRAILRRLVISIDQHPGIRCLWLEAERAMDLRALEALPRLHLSAADPDLDAVLCELRGILETACPLLDLSEKEPDDFGALHLSARLEGGDALDIVVEPLSLVGKRCRGAIQPLLDRTGELRYVVDCLSQGWPATREEA